VRTFLTALLIAAGSIAAAAQAQAPRSLHDVFDAQQCFKYTAQIAGFGERQPGQPGHVKTEQLIKSVVAKNGGQLESDDFTAQTPRGPLQVHNLIGKFNVTSDPKQEIFILAGHYDTLMKAGFIGANDGGSSTAILLSFADALAHQKTKMQVWLVWTDLEEGTFVDNDGLYGSHHLAAKLKANGLVPRIKGFFLLDMIGDKDLGVARETQSTRWLQDFISRAAQQLGYSKHFFQYESGITDDHVEFLNVGIPAVDVVDAEFGRMGPGLDGMGEFHHANTDTMDKVSAQSLEIVGKTILLTVELLDKQ
jgi:Zn-dependent M28 family amino/carboxypeptidase